MVTTSFVQNTRAQRKPPPKTPEKGSLVAVAASSDICVLLEAETGDLGMVGRIRLRLVDGDDRIALQSAQGYRSAPCQSSMGATGRTVNSENSPLKPMYEMRVVSSPSFEGKKRVKDRTEGNLAGLTRR